MNQQSPASATSDGIVLSNGITKRVHHLSDGRELIYFDDADSTLPPERAPDARPPAPRPAVATMRQDPLTGEWVSIASARQNRVMLPPKHLDPLAPSTPENLTEVPSNYDVAVFENKSPSFGPAFAAVTGDAGAAGEAGVSGEAGVTGDDAAAAASVTDAATLNELARIGLGRTRPSIGRCEVVCFSPSTDGSFATLSPSRARTVVEAWADRTAALSAMPGVEQVFPFENRGEAIGVTLHHPHGQIYAYPYITPRTQKLIASIESYGPTLFADILAFEEQSDRVIVRTEFFTAFVPFAARWPLEIHLLPHRHVPDFAGLTGEERDDLALVYRRILRAVDAIYDTPTPYIAAWHQAPTHAHRDDIRLMLQITSPRRAVDKLKFLAGSESAMGAFIGDVLPETSAALLRDALARSDSND
ncbi:galactose-1-phosphate uridylyltransferase [Herbiconiux daphne]|uniref:Galactose-1-phosphate uridylyltransferase n=1 Tax=Herbiconiux daphne TaxID=2970914 RepID=A0ABT2H8L4_9MICO|nr:galactose-1-phosphate uridylyltransferase [Herbiconiux daphne]MCS5736278.1 galactose-1-phosphate uridylyltransferase [Herbiconiux daphne]